jgi:ATP-dependent helicase/nuclease subunit B
LSPEALQAAGAFYLQLVRRIETVSHPAEGADPTDAKWLLKLKPRGIFDLQHLSLFDKDLKTGVSLVVQASINKDGSLSKRSNDAADTVAFRRLLDATQAKLAQLTDQIFAGEVSVTPYRLNQKSPCSGCGYRSVCRFDSAINKYNYLQSAIAESAEDSDG